MRGACGLLTEEFRAYHTHTCLWPRHMTSPTNYVDALCRLTCTHTPHSYSLLMEAHRKGIIMKNIVPTKVTHIMGRPL